MTTISDRPRLIAIALLSVTVMLAFGGPVIAKAPYFDWTYDPIKFDPPVPERWVMDNGMVVQFLPDDRLPVVTVLAIVRGGEAYLPADKAGLAAITGQALVTGGTDTRSPDDFDSRIEYYGIHFDGSIGDEAGDVSMECLTKDLDTAFTMFADILQHPRFDSAKFQLAVDDAVEDWRRRNDSPGRITSREFAKLIYGDHPYGRSPEKDVLESLKRSDAVDLCHRCFAPDNIILAVSGDLTKAQLEQLLKQHLSGWNATAEKLPPVPPVDESGNGGVYQINKDISQTNIRFGHIGIDNKNPDRHAIRVMNNILGGGGFTSRMMGRVRSDSGWAYSVGTRFTTGLQPGVFFASCQTKVETTSKALALMKWVVEDFVKNGITDDELATAKESILNSDVFQYTTPSQIVNQYAWLEYYGFPPDQLKKDVEAIRAVTKADVEAVAKKYLHPGKLTILAVGPVDKFDAPLSKFGNVNTIKLED